MVRSMDDSRGGVPVYWAELEVVSRRVNVPPAQVQDLLLDPAVPPADERLDLDGLGTWRLDEPFVWDEWSGDPEAGPLLRHRPSLCRRHRSTPLGCRARVRLQRQSCGVGEPSLVLVGGRA